MADARSRLGLASDALFYGYAGACVLAGAWGTVGATIDFPWLLHQPLGDLTADGRPNVLAQYRFLRAIECGFGVFAIAFRREIHTERRFNRLFLGTMGLGVAARALSMKSDGRPSDFMLAMLAWEAVGAPVIFAHTRRTLGVSAGTLGRGGPAR
ncbi:MAG: hypothetical protein QOJ52_3009 [Acidimicrobiaceae bacterium]|nr:hypothetical protein [Acidimicrobiaceae bacterium]